MNKAKYMTLFMHIVSSGSITKAAEKLDVSKSVVSHQLKLLEQELGVTLLKRTTRKQHLTAAGEAFYQDCCELNKITESAWLQAKEAQEEPKGKLKISAPHALMNTLIVPALAEAFRGNTKLNLELISSDTHQDLMQEDIDLTIRIGLSDASNLKQKRLGSFRDQVCQSRLFPILGSIVLKGSSEASFSSNKPIPEAIERAPYIANSWQGKEITHEFLSKINLKKQHLTFHQTHQANNLQSCIELIEQGFGIGIVPDFICRKHIKTLMPVLEGFELAENPIYALHPYQGITPIAVQMAITQIEKALGHLSSQD